jgi:hypothetical protein
MVVRCLFSNSRLHVRTNRIGIVDPVFCILFLLFYFVEILKYLPNNIPDIHTFPYLTQHKKPVVDMIVNGSSNKILQTLMDRIRLLFL